jgi:hypothetical protein
MEKGSGLGRSLADALARVAAGTLRTTLTIADVAVFSVLAMLAPFISVALIVLCLIGLAICLLFGVISPTPHFSMPLVLGFSAVCALLWAVFHAFMEWYPSRHGGSDARLDSLRSR